VRITPLLLLLLAASDASEPVNGREEDAFDVEPERCFGQKRNQVENTRLTFEKNKIGIIQQAIP